MTGREEGQPQTATGTVMLKEPKDLGVKSVISSASDLDDFLMQSVSQAGKNKGEDP